MRRVTVMNRHQAENAIAMNGPIISIRNSGAKPSDLSEFLAAFFMAFDDITYPQDNLRLFAKSHADFIKGLMGGIDGFEDVYVHCEAGVSRSVAVGLHIAEKQNRLLVLAAASSTIGANQHVLNMLRHDDRQSELDIAFRDL